MTRSILRSTAFAALVACSLAASAQSINESVAKAPAPAGSQTLYGVIDLSVRGGRGEPAAGTLSGPSTPNQTNMVSGGLRPSRLGFRGSEDLGSGSRAFYQLEAGFDAASGAGAMGAGVMFNRESHVGIASGSHAISMGRTYNEAYRSLSQFDPIGFVAQNVNPNAIAGSLSDFGTFGNNGGLGSRNLSSAVRYQGDFGPLGVSAQNSFGSAAAAGSRSSQGVSASYDFAQVSVGGSASRLRDAGISTLEAWTAGGTWHATENLNVSATYARQNVDGGALNGFGRRVGSLGATYAPGRVSYGLAYYGTRSNGAALDGDQAKVVGVTTYRLAPRTALYGELDFARNRGSYVVPGATTTRPYGLGVGVSHTF